MDANRAPRGRTRTPRPAARVRFSRDQIEEIKTTGKLVLCIVGSALLVVGCYFWLTGVIPGNADRPLPRAPDTVPEVSEPVQADGDAALRARAQQSCDEGNQDACTLLQQNPLDAVSVPPAGARKEP
jgi:hypothetical protein